MKASLKKTPLSLAQLLLRRLLFAYIIFALVITGIEMLIEYRVVSKDIIGGLQSMARTFSPSAESALWELEEPLLDSLVKGIGANPAVVSVDISDSDGNISASWRAPSGLRASPALTVQQTLYHIDGNSLKALGSLRIASSDTVLMSRLQETLWSVVITATAIFVCLGLLLWLLARALVVRPLVFFSDQVGELSVSGQGKPIDLGRVEVGEIETLKQGFNRLMQQLVASHTQIAEQNVLFQHEKALMRCIIDSIPDLIFIKDMNGSYLACNKAFEAFTGRPESEIIGKTDFDFFDFKTAEFFRQNDREMVELGTTRLNEESITYPDGHRVSLETLKTLYFGPDGKILGLVGISRDITERKASEEKIQHLAFYDHLTDLPNRLLLLDRLHQALASSARIGRTGALLFIDLDNFKNLNDTLGHDMGDMLLKQVTQRLKSCIREGDTVARLGGDEFVVMLLDLSEQPIEAAAQTEAIGEKILTALSHPYQLDKNIYRCTASIGVTLFNGKQDVTDELMKQADIAMYQAKKAGRNALRFFDKQMQENISARVSLEGELHHAIEFQQFHLYYQIQVDDSHRPLGAEALIRWVHPARGLIHPASFIPLAEETGLILPIGLWVLETACARIKAWEHDARTRNLTLAVNVSAKQFRQADFVDQVQSAVQRHSINPELLKFELTESLLQENIEETISIMNALNEIGIQFALDDFGTGYSSLQYLKRLPLDQIKIDQSFVRDIATDVSDIAVVRATIAMARSLELNIIAEGVETEEQRQLLVINGCSNYQGFLFGKPVPVDQFEALVKQS